MLNRRQKGAILLTASLIGSLYVMMSDSTQSNLSPYQLLVVLWVVVLASFGIYLLFVAED